MSEPLPIKKLDEHVINRIAAGEVIQRPANALKEMIENSIDAKSTIIQVIVKEGGLKLLQIIDNGTGIRMEDFDIVCERFTTSKLEKFEDLSCIDTYGFRGEALASISHISHLTIQSKTSNQECAFKACYVDSILKDPPKPCAGNVGTIITVEDLFYNMTTRRKALKNATEEFRKICDMMGKYAIHNSAVSFSLKKYGENVTIKTQMNSSILDNIRNIYGNSTAKELVNFELKDTNLKFTASGFSSNFNYSAKKGIFILFINERLVESSVLKKGIDLVYNSYLPKNSFPFIYLSIKVDPQNVDVNVHPTKHQVNFLYEDQIAELIAIHIEQKILKSNTSRTFYTQTKLPGAQSFKNETNDEKSKQNGRDDKSFVRTNCTDQKLDKFILKTNKSSDTPNEKLILNMSSVSQNNQIEKRETSLSSVHRLRKIVEENCHMALRELIAEHVFVGSIDINRTLIQHNTKLYYCHNQTLLQELFYQIIIHNFQNFGTITFSNPLSIKQLILIALDLPETKWTPEDGEKNMLADSAVKILMEKAALMDDYFSLTVDSDQNLVNIPLLIDNYIPEVAGLPKYILKLATDVNWKKEQECFDSFARVTGRYYALRKELNQAENINWKWTTEYILYPTLKKYLLPPKTFAKNGAILQLADLPDLYKVFERC